MFQLFTVLQYHCDTIVVVLYRSLSWVSVIATPIKCDIFNDTLAYSCYKTQFDLKKLHE